MRGEVRKPDLLHRDLHAGMSVLVGSDELLPPLAEAGLLGLPGRKAQRGLGGRRASLGGKQQPTRTKGKGTTFHAHDFLRMGFRRGTWFSWNGVLHVSLAGWCG